MSRSMLVLIISLFLSSVMLFSQNANDTPTQMIGAMFTVQVPNKPYRDGNPGGDIFYRKHFDFLSDNAYLVLNAGYTHKITEQGMIIRLRWEL